MLLLFMHIVFDGGYRVVVFKVNSIISNAWCSKQNVYQILLILRFSAGEPISCIHDGAVPTHVINTFCWVMYTFSIPRQQYKHIGTEVANYGLGNEYNNEKRFHSYYQWVPFMLFFQVSIQKLTLLETNY